MKIISIALEIWALCSDSWATIRRVQYQEKALKIEPNNSGLLGNMGNVLRDLKRHEESEKCFTRAIEIIEQNIGLKLGLVITLNAQENTEVLTMKTNIEKN